MVPESYNSELCGKPTSKEVKSAVFSLNRDASVGPDVYTAQFYHSCWSFIQDDLVEAVQDYFDGAPLSVGISATSLAFVPKSMNPESWSNYRAISLCNFLTKLLLNC